MCVGQQSTVKLGDLGQGGDFGHPLLAQYRLHFLKKTFFPNDMELGRTVWDRFLFALNLRIF